MQVHNSLKVEVDRVVKKTFGMFSFIGQNIEYRSWDILLKLYKTLVRPHLEYCVQSGHPIIERILLN